MQLASFGNKTSPALVCVPGLLGGPEDFRPFLPQLAEHYHVLILDPNAERRDAGLSNLTADAIREVSYSSTAHDIVSALEELGHDKAYLLGVSLGGKVVYDFAIRYPDKLKGALITDVGVDPFEDSELFKIIHGFVTNAPMHLPWPEMKQAIRDAIDDRNLRSLIQTQVFYPDQKPPAVWKTGMKNFESMLKRQSISHQHEDMFEIDEELAARETTIHVLHAEKLSGISSECYERMKAMKSIRFHEVPDSTHFLHVTHKELISELALGLARP